MGNSVVDEDDMPIYKVPTPAKRTVTTKTTSSKVPPQPSPRTTKKGYFTPSQADIAHRTYFPASQKPPISKKPSKPTYSEVQPRSSIIKPVTLERNLSVSSGNISDGGNSSDESNKQHVITVN